MTSSGIRVTAWDRFLISIAPSWGVKRLRAKATAVMLARHYDAAQAGRRTSGWHRRATDANAASAASLGTLRDLARDLRRNNGWARRGIQVIGNNTVGWGIEAKAKDNSTARRDAAQRIWSAWADTAQCDYEGRLPFTGLQRLVMETVVESGGAVVIREPASTRDGLPVPIRIRVLEPDYLDHTKDGVFEGRPVIQGVEFDGRGRRVAYWLYSNHPGGTYLMPTRFESIRVPAENVIHVYRVDRPGQVRGVPWLAAAIARLHDYDDYDDALLMQRKMAACFAAFVQDLDGSGAIALGEQDPEDRNLERLEPGQIEYLPPGKSVTFAQPPSTTDHSAFSVSQLRAIAAALGVTYEDLSGDFSQVNFSSARMGRLSHWANVYDWRWHMLIPQFCGGVWRWVMSLAAELRGWKTVPSAEWAPPPMPMLEPEKEGLAMTRLVRSGVMSLSQAIRERGEDPIAHLAEIAEDNRRLDEFGIVLDSDPRRTTTSGQAQRSDSGQPPSNDDGEDNPDDAATDGG